MDTFAVGLLQSMLIRVRDPDVRNAEPQKVGNSGQCFGRLIVRREDLDNQVGWGGEDGLRAIGQPHHADIRDAVQMFCSEDAEPLFGQDAEPAFTLQREQQTNGKRLQSAVLMFTHVPLD